MLGVRVIPFTNRDRAGAYSGVVLVAATVAAALYLTIRGLPRKRLKDL